MARPDRPLFVATKGMEGDSFGTIDPEDILDRFEDIYTGLIDIEGDGLPEDMPSHYFMRALFNCGGIQLKDAGKLGRVLLGVKPSLWSVYGTPLAAVPVIMNGSTDASLLEASDAPCLWIGKSPREKLRPYAELMSDVLNTLGQNITALSQPVIVQGTQGGEINAIEVDNTITRKKRTLTVLDKAATQAQVLDLGAQDHTQNLIATFRALYAECLTIIGVQGSGSEKASGMTSEETTCVMQQVNMVTYDLLTRFEQWVDKVNARFGTSLKAVVGAGWTVSMDDDPEEAKVDEKEEPSDEE